MLSGLVMKYFVLSPTKRGIYGKASRLAIKEYARIVKSENYEFAWDLDKWIRDIERDMIKEDADD